MSVKKNVDICAVVVLYNCLLSDSESINSLHESLVSENLELDIVVYDNSKFSNFQNENYMYSHFRIHYYHNKDNPGVSSAYNYGAKICGELGLGYLLLLDQDTLLPISAIQVYSNAIRDWPQVGIFVPKLYVGEHLMSPCISVMKKSFELNDVNPGTKSLSFKSFFNSGILISLDIYNTAGGFNEKVKLYFSDFNFVERLKKIRSNFVLLPISCVHHLNSNNENNFELFLNTFDLYLDGAFYAGESKSHQIQFLVLSFARSIKLSFKYRNDLFVKKYVSKLFKR